MANMSLKLYTNGFFGLVLKSPFQIGTLSVKNRSQISHAWAPLNEGMYCLGVFLDLHKAFDVCLHEILLKKLKKMGILGVAHKWFTIYLSNRAQCVDIAGTFSDLINLDISVIRGTLQIILDLCIPEKELAKTRSQISFI
jgi:hypothetical protein